MAHNFATHGEKNMDDIPANEKTGNYYKDIKQYVFTTQNPNGTVFEISVRATTDLSLSLKNSGISATLADKNFEEEDDEGFLRNKQKTTPNVPAFWTMLAKAINGSTAVTGGGNQLLQPIPGSDVNSTNVEEKLSNLEALKLKLMVGIALMTLLIFIPLLIFCIITLHRLKQLSHKYNQSQYSIDPELAVLSYFQPSEGVSDMSFSKSADSSTQIERTPSDLRQPRTRMPEDIAEPDLAVQPEESELLINEEANEAANEGNDVQ
ncbi:equatorin [Octodon degus]|uniref:Equatorin n=1 Tax=Octodon degus TaxID=10160 RepID=A0A6P6F4S0_OCTDE|nr:equatorin [Octodon degus]